jgi:hypothetical protein
MKDFSDHQKMKQSIIFLVALFTFIQSPGIDRERPGFAIVVDQKSYEAAGSEIDDYARSVENQGLKVFLLAGNWNSPDTIREKLKKLHFSKTNPLEGAVFIGDIPVPMIRDAQHFTSAFKMDQERYPWNRSSIPSDRFYEDFDLQLTWLKQDSVNLLLHYFSLNAESAQRLTPDIYSGRIKPPEGPQKYEMLKAYLKKVKEAKAHPQKADQVLFFTGHGYNSECPRTWMDEKMAIDQQFSYLRGQQNYLEYINFKDEDQIKFRLMAELKRNDLDIALLHHHGAPNAQYLNGMPAVRSIPDEVEDVKFYLRSKLRDAGDSEEKRKSTMENYMKTYGVPESWFDGAFDREQTAKDSIFSANMDIYTEDLENYSSNARFIMLDACFTGSFHLDNYLAGNYIFDEGNTLVLQANSVNAFQDKWPDEMAGLLGLGLRTGFWNQMNCSLETHLIGDPTFCFVPADAKINLNIWLSEQKNDLTFWLKQLSSPYADVQALALRNIFEKEGTATSDLIFDVFKTSEFFTVRMEAFKLLCICRDENYTEAVNLGISDSYELIQRIAAIQMGNSGNPKHIPFLIHALLRNNVSKRVEYDLKTAASMFDKKLLLEELNLQIPGKEFLLNPGETRKNLTQSVEYSCDRLEQDVNDLFSDQIKKKEKVFNLRNFRNMTIHPYLEKLISFTDSTEDPELKLIAVEMLGWFDQSWKRDKIIAFCEQELAKTDLEENYRNEVIKTKNRIQ